ncbi:MAG: adenosylmethionine--8-amino-7-oxononanoate transaminase [Chitinivibrionales bacterium]
MNKREIQTKHIWHPDTNMPSFRDENFPVIKKGRGNYLYTTEGEKLFDAISSWWCVNFGHGRAEIVDAIVEQLHQLQHTILGGMSHEPAIALAEKLAGFTPQGLDRFFFASDGSSAVEASLRMALQYWENVGFEDRKKFISIQNSYHGDTLGAVGVGFLDTFHHALRGAVKRSFQGKAPICADCPFGKRRESCEAECFDDMKKVIESHHHESAAVIVEPIVQGAGNINMYSQKYLIKLQALCKKYNLLLIFDEIAVGCCRLGDNFAADFSGVTPDILVMGKGLTGGYLPMSVAAVNDRIFSSFDNTIFWHSHTFGGNPPAAAAALAALDLYKDGDIRDYLRKSISLFRQYTTELMSRYEYFMDTVGLIFKIVIDEGSGKSATEVQNGMRKKGIRVRPIGDTLYFWPPLTTSHDEIHNLFECLQKELGDR